MAVYVPVPGSDRALPSNAVLAGPVDPAQLASVTVRLRSKGDAGALAGLAYELGSLPPARRTYLTHAQLEERHGAFTADLDAIERFAQVHDLAVLRRSALERSVVLHGPLGRLLDAFHADVQLYRKASEVFRGRCGPVLVPEELAGMITGVFGLDTHPRRRSTHKAKRAAMAAQGAAGGVPASEFARRYRFPDQAGGARLDGSGQTIAIIELGGGFRFADLKAYFDGIGAPVPAVSSVCLDHAQNDPTTPGSADGEVMLDIEVAGAAAPKAAIVVYFGSGGGDQGFLDAISAAVHDAQRKPGVIAISWGNPESAGDAQGTQAYHELFAAAGALGITVCVASGDHGTADEDASHWDRAIHVDHPACDDLVLGCGGTQIDPPSRADAVWNDNTPFDAHRPGGGGWASGGGISQVFAVPSYQQGSRLPPALAGGKPGRGVPDVAMSATNYRVRVDADQSVSGGTSAVAPLMAALVARLNQALGCNVGFLNPFLYARAAGPGAVVQAVTSGTNGIAQTVEGYAAGPGWNACTGLGTPDGAALLAALSA